MPNHPLFDENDLTRLLLNESGSFDHLHWQTIPGKDDSSNAAWLVSVHEAYHGELNNATMYGGLLTAYAYLSKEMPEQEIFRKNLQYLVGQSRNAHEVYATFLSVQGFNNPIGLRSETPESLLRGHSTYMTYFKQGNWLTRDFEGSFLKEKALTGLIFACFQGEAFYEIPEKGFVNFSPSDIRQRAYPDSKLSWLSQNLDDDFFRASFERFCQGEVSPSIAMLFKETEHSGTAIQQAIVPENDPPTEALINHFFSDVQALLHKGTGLQTLSRSMNRVWFEQLFEACNAIVPPEQQKSRLVLNDKFNDTAHNIFLNFQQERILLREKPLAAEMYWIGDIETSKWPTLTTGSNDNLHSFFVCKMGTKVLEQFDFDASNRAFLENWGQNALLYLQRRAWDGNQYRIELILFNEAEYLEQFMETIENRPVYGAFSALALTDNAWITHWHHTVRHFKKGLILMDIPLMPTLQNLVEDYQTVNWQVIKMQMPNNEVRTALLLQGTVDEKGGNSSFYAALCSEPLIGAFKQYMLANYILEKFVQTDEFYRGYETAVNTVLSHLFNEEFYFDFRA